MKNILIPIIVAFALVILASCEIEGDKAMIKPSIEGAQLQQLPASSYVLLFEESGDDFDAFNWSEVDFGFPASIDYTLQMDKEGSNFSDPVDLITVNNQVSVALTKGEINEALLTLELEPDQSASVQVRVMASIGDRVDPVNSSPLSVTITPYATTFPPIYIIGDAQSWDLASAMQLKSTGPGTYEGIGAFVQDGKFRLFRTPDWVAEQWGFSYFAAVDDDLADGNDNDSNFIFTLEDGLYKVTVSLTDKSIVIEPSSAPTLFIIGDAQGWDPVSALGLKSLGAGVFEGIGHFQEDGLFRFFVAPDWNATQYGFAHFEDGTIPASLEDGGNDSNFLFKGANGIYKITVSLNEKTIEITPSAEPELYIIGDDQAWTLGSAFQLTWLGGGKYSGTTDFTNGAAFRFFDAPDWPNGFGNYPYFAAGDIDAALENANDNDSNFKFAGTTGAYLIEVDIYNPKIKMTAQ